MQRVEDHRAVLMIMLSFMRSGSKGKRTLPELYQRSWFLTTWLENGVMRSNADRQFLQTLVSIEVVQTMQDSLLHGTARSLHLLS